ncbi:unnamed protein product [Arctogadus glacialis]
MACTVRPQRNLRMGDVLRKVTDAWGRTADGASCSLKERPPLEIESRAGWRRKRSINSSRGSDLDSPANDRWDRVCDPAGDKLD